jgi:hypothetical protein
MKLDLLRIIEVQGAESLPPRTVPIVYLPQLTPHFASRLFERLILAENISNFGQLLLTFLFRYDCSADVMPILYDHDQYSFWTEAYHMLQKGSSIVPDF